MRVRLRLRECGTLAPVLPNPALVDVHRMPALTCVEEELLSLSHCSSMDSKTCAARKIALHSTQLTCYSAAHKDFTLK